MRPCHATGCRAGVAAVRRRDGAAARRRAAAADARRGDPARPRDEPSACGGGRPRRGGRGRRRRAARRDAPADRGAGRLHAHEPRRGVRHRCSPDNQLRVIYPDVPDNYRTRLDLQWPIYTGGRLDALERAARIDATASADEIAARRAAI